VGLIFKYLL